MSQPPGPDDDPTPRPPDPGQGPAAGAPGEGWAQAAPGGPPPAGPGPGYGAPPGYLPPDGAVPPSPYGPGGPALPPPPAKRFSGGMIAAGVFVGMTLAVGVPLLALGIGSTLVGDSGSGAAVAVTLAVAVLAPLVLGIVLVRKGTPERRGLGLGLLIGWAVVTIVGGGLCIAIIAALSSGTGP